MLNKFTFQSNEPTLSHLHLAYCYKGSICRLHQALDSNNTPNLQGIHQISGNSFHSFQILKSHYSVLSNKEATTIDSVGNILDKLKSTEILERLGCISSNGNLFMYRKSLKSLFWADHLVARLATIIVKNETSSSTRAKRAFTLSVLKNITLHMLFMNFNERWNQAKNKYFASNEKFRKSLYDIFNVNIDLITEYIFLISGIPQIFINRICTSRNEFIVDTLSTSVLIATQIVYNSNPSEFFFLDTEVPEHIKENKKFIELKAKALDVLENKKLPLKFIQKSEKFVAYNYE